MASNKIARLKKLEAAFAPKGRVFTLWDDGETDIDAETERLCVEQGMTDWDTLVIAKWLDAEPSHGPRE